MKKGTKTLIGKIRKAREFGLGMVPGHGKKQKRTALANQYRSRGLGNSRKHIKKMF